LANVQPTITSVFDEAITFLAQAVLSYYQRLNKFAEDPKTA